MAAIETITAYKKTVCLIIILILMVFTLCHTLLRRPLVLLREQKELLLELATYPQLPNHSRTVFIKEMKNLDVMIMKEITDGGCVIIQGEIEQILKDDDLELLQYEFAFSGRYPELMSVWQNISSIMSDDTHITHCRIASERDKDRKGWLLVCRITLQTIRTR